MPKKRRVTAPEPRKKARAGRDPKAVRGKEDSGTRARLNVPGAAAPFEIVADETELQDAAMRWTYVVRNRRRWADRGRARAEQSDASRELLKGIGIELEALEEVAEAGVVEVDVPFVSEEVGWEQRIFPWEYMIAAATRDLRGDRDLTVVRRLRVPLPARRRAPGPVLHVETAPGRLRKDFVFASERELLRSSFESSQFGYERLVDPMAEDLAAKVAKLAPGVVHLSGFDVHQGLELLERSEPKDVPDGLLLRGAGREPDVLPALGVARALAGAPSKPLLVGCNVFHSASRIAPLCVAEGAEAAIGFQDSFDDGLAELFFSTFYRAWRLSGFDTARAFRYAWTFVSGQDRPLQGTGVVLWSARSILDPPVPVEGAQPGEAPVRSSAEIDVRLKKEIAKSRVELSSETVRDLLEVEIQPVSGLNYSILHNNGSLFERFRILKKGSPVGRVDELFVGVELHVGTDSYPFRMQLSLDERESVRDLSDEIRVSLASALGRAIRESVHTSLFVEVLWRDTTLYRRTHRVTLLPIDEWRDDDLNRMWLPSFVLPRDPAVLRTIEGAQRYLMALRDDATAGFDGYQAVDDPEGNPARACEAVDMQVRAIWSALLHDTPLAYINPPPTFTESSQRLRTPTDVLAGGRGTCIDLALLLASCLEYVEIYPAVILLRSHAFPAYWRHDRYHDAFRHAREAGGPPSPADASRGAGVPSQRFGWYLEKPHYPEIVREVHAGRLVPLETVWLTQRGGFAEAVEEGLRNLSGRREFDSMLDVTLARTDSRTPVTPLPIRRSES